MKIRKIIEPIIISLILYTLFYLYGIIFHAWMITKAKTPAILCLGMGLTIFYLIATYYKN